MKPTPGHEDAHDVPIPRGIGERPPHPWLLQAVRTERPPDVAPTAVKRIALPSGAATGLTTAHGTIVAADIKGFGQYSRTNINQVRVRHGMYGAMQQAFETAAIPWTACRREDRGDGVLVLAPGEVPKALFVDRLPNALASALSRHNRIHPAVEQIRLRLAIHAGEFNYDEHGVTGCSITHTFRLLDADVLRGALEESSAVLAIIGSAWFFDEVIRQSEGSHVESYSPAEVTNKEAKTQAWIRLVNAPAAPRHRPRATGPTSAPYRSGIRAGRLKGRNRGQG